MKTYGIVFSLLLAIMGWANFFTLKQVEPTPIEIFDCLIGLLFTIVTIGACINNFEKESKN